MIYPPNCVIQTLQIPAALNTVQLPCYEDQKMPAEGFRAITFPITFGNNAPFQTGQPFTNGNPGAVDVSLTAIQQNNLLQKVRSIMMYAKQPTENTTRQSLVCRTGAGYVVPCGVYYPFNSGLNSDPPPAGTYLIADLPVSMTDTLSFQAGTNVLIGAYPQIIVCLANFRLSPVAFQCPADPLFGL